MADHHQAQHDRQPADHGQGTQQPGSTQADLAMRSRDRAGYVPRRLATTETYRALGFMSGLEVHQQLATRKKLFCRCPVGLYQDGEDRDAEVVRHMRPTLSEMGEYDGTALMEKKTRKNITYRIKNESACTYDIDDTPPFAMNRDALRIAVRISLMLGLSIVGELHITRKQYLDGSIPTGFQRTGIIGIEGEIPLGSGRVRIMQLSIEEDSCREVSDRGHQRVYTTDRLGTPLIETVTHPDMKTPDEVAEAAQYIRFLNRSSGEVRTGSGAARQDVNVSITGGTRVEIKGVAHIAWIPDLVHIEAFRQKALLEIKRILNERVPGGAASWTTSHAACDTNQLPADSPVFTNWDEQNNRLVAINLPRYAGLLSFFTQPGQTFASELSQRLKVIACLERPNLLASENQAGTDPLFSLDSIAAAVAGLDPGPGDAQVLVWGPAADIATAIETVDERCRLAFEGVPNETRKSRPDGTTVFERVLPGPNRMYPDTDSAPIAIEQELIDECGANLPTSVAVQMDRLREWSAPADTHTYLLRHNLVDVVHRCSTDFGIAPRRIATLLAHRWKHITAGDRGHGDLISTRLYELLALVHARGLTDELLDRLLPALHRNPYMTADTMLATSGFVPASCDEIVGEIPKLTAQFDMIRTSPAAEARTHWVMGQLRDRAVGNMPMSELRANIERVAAHA